MTSGYVFRSIDQDGQVIDVLVWARPGQNGELHRTSAARQRYR
jgi:hypothetical protein